MNRLLRHCWSLKVTCSRTASSAAEAAPAVQQCSSVVDQSINRAISEVEANDWFQTLDDEKQGMMREIVKLHRLYRIVDPMIPLELSESELRQLSLCNSLRDARARLCYLATVEMYKHKKEAGLRPAGFREHRKISAYDELPTIPKTEAHPPEREVEGREIMENCRQNYKSMKCYHSYRLERCEIKGNSARTEVRGWISGPKILLDVWYAPQMSLVEQQLSATQTITSIFRNRRFRQPADITICNVRKDTYFWREGVRKFCKTHDLDGDFADLYASEKSPIELFPKEDVVILSPDSPNEAGEDFDWSKTLVIGAVVDKMKPRKNLTLDYANSLGVETVKLPLRKHLNMLGLTMWLPLNVVLSILLDAYATGNDWGFACRNNVAPIRILKEGDRRVEALRRMDAMILDEGFLVDKLQRYSASERGFRYWYDSPSAFDHVRDYLSEFVSTFCVML